MTTNNLIRRGWSLVNICHLCMNDAELACHMFYFMHSWLQWGSLYNMGFHPLPVLARRLASKEMASFNTLKAIASIFSINLTVYLFHYFSLWLAYIFFSWMQLYICEVNCVLFYFSIKVPNLTWHKSNENKEGLKVEDPISGYFFPHLIPGFLTTK